MKKLTGLTLSVLFLTGCATHGQVQQVETTSEANQKLLRENESRLHDLESSVTALNTQVAQLNNRVYEVRTKSGQRTAMTVVPIMPKQGSAVPEPAGKVVKPAPAQVAAKKQPAARRIDPASRPAPLAAAKPAPVPDGPRGGGASGRVGQPETVAGPAGQISSSQDLGLPPADIPSANAGAPARAAVEPSAPTRTNNSLPPVPQNNSVPVPQNNSVPVPQNNAVPVPVIAAQDISLPPENPDLPTAVQPAPAPAAQAGNRTPATRAPARGEEAAYQAALKAARSGRTAEGIRLFRDFLQRYPNGRYAANADFWIGECLYSEGKYKDALDQFQVVNNTFPRHHKNADALLKAGMTLSKMGDSAGAQAKYKELISSFPNSDAARRARAMGVGR